MVAGVVSTLGEVGSTLGEEGLEVDAGTLAAVISVVAAATLVVAVVATASAGGGVTMVPDVLATAPVAADTATTERNMVREEDSAMDLAGAMLAMVVVVVTRAMALAPLAEAAIMSRGNQATRRVQVSAEIGTTLAMEEISIGGALGVVAPW
jgi:hypothetical protein